MLRPKLSILCLALLSLCAGFAQGQPTPSLQQLAQGLYYPVDMVLLPDGGLLIAEAGGQGERSAGISLLLPDGRLGRLLSGLPNAVQPNTLPRGPALALSGDGASILVALPGSQLWQLPAALAQELPDTALRPQDLELYAAQPGGQVLLHPAAITIDAASGIPIVSDAMSGSLLRADAAGSLRPWRHFPALDKPKQPGEHLPALPTGLASADSAVYGTLLGGCPHVHNSGELFRINAQGEQRLLVDGLNMPIDLALDAAGQLWILEFAALEDLPCFYDLPTRPASGRLSRVDSSGIMQTVLDELHFPSALLPMPDGSLYISEVFSGRLMQLLWNAPPPALHRYPPQPAPARESAAIHDLDQALRTAIEQHNLQPFPGQEQRLPESALTRLGRDLFFDPILSGDQNISCATCHHPSLAMADGRALPIGTGGHGLGPTRSFRAAVDFVPRNSPSLINSALLQRQFWDGRVELRADGTVHSPEASINRLLLRDPLQAQALFPIISQREMAGNSLAAAPPMAIRQSLLQRLQQHNGYAQRFAAVFGQSPVTMQQLGAALAAFQRQLIFTAAPWDTYIAGDSAALTKQQKQGALRFFGARKDGVNCAACHSGELFTDQSFHNLLVPQLGPGKDNGASRQDDFGRANVSFDYRDQYRFRTPSLRNVELTAPYFHSGAYTTLEAVIAHHLDPWRAALRYDASLHLPPATQPRVLAQDFRRQTHSVAPPMQGSRSLPASEIAELAAFLRALTDPAARDLSHILPHTVPSGLPIDPPSPQ